MPSLMAAEMGGDVLDWNGVWSRILAQVKIAETEEILPEVAKTRADSIALDHLPRLDFSYYDRWLDLPKRPWAGM